jgi:hypothetical protein
MIYDQYRHGLILPNVGWLLISTRTSMYLIYEFMHFCCHVDENWFVRHTRFVNTLWRHHTAHHDQSIMIFAMWPFPEVKRADTVGEAHRDIPRGR